MVDSVNQLKYSKERRQQGSGRQKENTTKFAQILEKSLTSDNNEIKCSTKGYGKTGAYQEYNYFTREYR